MKNFLMAVIIAVSAGAAHAGQALDQLGLGGAAIQLPAPQPVQVKISRPASESGDLVGLYEIWLKDDFQDPKDKTLVEREMHNLVDASINRAELVMSRVKLNNQVAVELNQIAVSKARLTAYCDSIRTPQAYGYMPMLAKMSDAEIVVFFKTQANVQLSAQVQHTRDRILLVERRLELQEKRRQDIVSEVARVDARLADLPCAYSPLSCGS